MLRPIVFARVLGILAAGAAAALADSTVVFNEIQYHPLGNEAELEWVELHNQMAADMDISGWALTDGIAFDFPDGTIVPGGGFVVVAASPAALAAATGFADALGPFTGRLDNSGENLDLRSNSGRLMDSVKYKDSGEWPAGADGSGATLAKRDPDLGSSATASWIASEQMGGTPGQRNFVVEGTPASLPKELISYWSLDQSSGAMVDLASGSNGTLGSGATRVDGVVGTKAVSFNNTTSAFISVGSGVSNSFSTTTGITLEAIVKAQWSGAVGDQDEIFRKEDGDNRILFSLQNDGNTNGLSFPAIGPGPVLSFGLNVGGAYTELDMLLDGAAGRPSLSDFQDGSTHHVAATYDSASGLKAIYVDGTLAFSVNMGAGKLITSGGTTTAYIGNMSGRAEPFTGILDEVAVWKKAISAADVSKHAENIQAGKTYFESESTPGGVTRPKLAFNEAFAPLVGDGWFEILNHGATSLELKDHVIAKSDGAETYVFPSRTLAAGAYLALTEAQLGFDLVPGQTIFLLSPARKIVVDAVHLEEGLRGRRPDGTGSWLIPDKTTLGLPNSFKLRDEIVINEILYHHMRIIAGGVLQDSPEGWIELYNRGAATVDLTGWKVSGGIDFIFENGTSLTPGSYLVVSNDKARLQQSYPAIRIVGNFTGRLSHKGDKIALTDNTGNPADEVHYYDSGRWPIYADGGGSSLELRDPDADNSRAEAWAASDESAKSSWKTYTYKMNAAANVGPAQWNEFVLGLLDEGEALIDDLSVIETPATAPKEVLQNGTFDAGTDKWRLLGNHSHSSATADPGNPAEEVLHLVATGATEHMHNHLETTLAGGARVTNGREYQISYRARWLAGSNQLNTRLYFNRCPKTTLIDVPALNGTPGARNSRFEANIGPTFEGFGHSPVVPAATDAVTVVATAQDPDGVGACSIFYSVAGAAWKSVVMTNEGGGRYRGTIPAQAASSLVQFYVEGTDGLGVKSTYPLAGPDSRAMYKVNDGQAILGRVHNLRIVMTTADTNILHLDTNVMSNDRLGSTVIYDEREAFYDVRVRLKGSERGRNVSGRVGFNIKLDPDHRFRGVHQSIQADRSGGWKFGGPSGQDEIIVKHIACRAGDLPAMYDDVMRVLAPRAAQTGPALLIMAAYGDVFLDSQYEGGTDGNAFELELIYSPTSTADGRPEGLKRPEPDDVLGTDFRDLGNDKEAYRWTFLKEGNRIEDDYSGLIALCKAFGAPAATLGDATNAVMDADEWMRAFVLYSLCGITDAYTRGNNHNLIVYQRPDDGKFLAFPWDLDFSWVQSTSSALWGDQNLGRITQLNPNRRSFYGHALDFIETTFNTTYMARWTAHYGSLAGADYSSILTYIGQRRTYVQGAIPANVPFAISSNGGVDFSVDASSAILEGNAWFDSRLILADGIADPIELTWTTPTHWKTEVPLHGGANAITFVSFGRNGNVLASDSITVTSTVGGAPPVITSVAPPAGSSGDTITVKGTGFLSGIRVFFGAVESAMVSFNAGVDPGTLTARVPSLPVGAVSMTLRNTDGRTSAGAAFTVTSEPVFIRGDVNRDGAVDLADAIRLLFYLYRGSSITCEDAADANNNELLDVADAIFLLNYLFKGFAAPTAPFPAAGLDSGPEGTLACQN